MVEENPYHPSSPSAPCRQNGQLGKRTISNLQLYHRPSSHGYHVMELAAAVDELQFGGSSRAGKQQE
jgi:hypothetical protein